MNWFIQELTSDHLFGKKINVELGAESTFSQVPFG